MEWIQWVSPNISQQEGSGVGQRCCGLMGRRVLRLYWRVGLTVLVAASCSLLMCLCFSSGALSVLEVVTFRGVV